MRQHGHYADSGVNPMVAAQMHHMASQRMQQNAGINCFSGREETLRAEEERQYMPGKSEGQWQWEREGSRASNSMTSHAYNEGQGSEATRSLYQGQKSDLNLGLDKQANQDLRTLACHGEMERGYDDKNLPQTFEGLEQKFLEDILKLTKEQQDAEDSENARHRERLSEINKRYQEKLLALRARQAAQRDEVLRKETQTRRQQYQQVYISSYQHSGGPNETHGLCSAGGIANALGDAHRPHGAGHFDSYGERTEYLESTGGRGYESRGPYPGGRAYNSGGRRY